MCAGAAGTADAVHIVLRHIGQLKVHHVRQLVNVDAACGNVGGHQHLQVAGLEFGQCFGACGLAFVAVDGHGGDVLFEQMLHQTVRAVFHAREHQHLVPIVFFDQVGEQVFLHLPAHGVHFLCDGVVGLVATRHFNQGGLVEQLVGEGFDVVAEGRGEQQALFFGRHQGQYFFDVVHKPHVQHAVGFVQHKNLDVRQIQRALAGVVEQAARCGHQDVHAFAQFVDLRLHADTTKHHHGGQRQVLAIKAHTFFHLRCELACGGQDEGANGDAAFGVTHRFFKRQAMQHGQHKTSGFAGAGLCTCEQVAAGEHGGNGLRLNRGRGGVTLLVDSTKQRLGQAEGVERHGGNPKKTDRPVAQNS